MQGREVFAIPGSIHNPLARGCHQLIRNGAKLVETAEEITSELAPLASRLGDKSARTARIGAERRRSNGRTTRAPAAVHAGARARSGLRCLFGALGHDALGIDQLAERTGLPVRDLVVDAA